MNNITKILLTIVFLLFVPNRTVYNYNLELNSTDVFTGLRSKDIIDKQLPYSGINWDYKNFTIQRTRQLSLDWKLILAIIKQESQFNTYAVSPMGAQGLMQLHPSTQKDFGMDSLEAFHPYKNIDVGVTYFSRLYSLFEKADEPDRTCLTLAAYNAGPSRIYDAQELVAYLGENPLSWRAIQNALPLLSKRFYTLHKSVWEGGKPRYGYFGGWRQTINYVENVLKYHKLYSRSAN